MAAKPLAAPEATMREPAPETGAETEDESGTAAAIDRGTGGIATVEIAEGAAAGLGAEIAAEALRADPTSHASQL